MNTKLAILKNLLFERNMLVEVSHLVQTNHLKIKALIHFHKHFLKQQSTGL